MDGDVGHVHAQRQRHQAHFREAAGRVGQDDRCDRHIRHPRHQGRKSRGDCQHQDGRAQPDLDRVEDLGRLDPDEPGAHGRSQHKLCYVDEFLRRRRPGDSGCVHDGADRHRPQQDGRRKPQKAGQRPSYQPASQKDRQVQRRAVDEADAEAGPVGHVQGLEQPEPQRHREHHQQNAGRVRQGNAPFVRAHLGTHQYHLVEAAGHCAEVGGQRVISRDTAEIGIDQQCHRDDIADQQSEAGQPLPCQGEDLRMERASQHHAQDHGERRPDRLRRFHRQLQEGGGRDKAHGSQHPGQGHGDPVEHQRPDRAHRQGESHGAEPGPGGAEPWRGSLGHARARPRRTAVCPGPAMRAGRMR